MGDPRTKEGRVFAEIASEGFDVVVFGWLSGLGANVILMVDKIVYMTTETWMLADVGCDPDEADDECHKRNMLAQTELFESIIARFETVADNVNRALVHIRRYGFETRRLSPL